MIVVFAPSRSKAEKAAIRNGLHPGVDCILVWNMETINLTCLADYAHPSIEEDAMNISDRVRAKMSRYLAEIATDPGKGFGWRNYISEDDPNPHENF